LQFQGLGDLSLSPAALLQFAQDCDGAMLDMSGALRAWYGYNRRGARLLKTAVHGAAGNRIDIVAASERYIRKRAGRLLAAVDAAATTHGRVLAIAHNEAAIKGTETIGRPVLTTGSGLNDLETRGIFSGAAAALYVVEIDSSAADPDTFRWSNDGGATWEVEDVNITGGWQMLELGIEIKFAAINGHTLGNAWTIAVGGRPALMATMNRVGPHDYPYMAGGQGKVLLGTGYQHPLVDDGLIVRAAGFRAPHLKMAIAAASYVDPADATDIADTDGDPTQWVALAEGVVCTAVDTPEPASGATHAVLIDPPSSPLGKIDLAYIDVSGSVDANVKRVQFWAYRPFATSTIQADHRALVFAAGAGLTGERVELLIRVKIPGLRWVRIDLPWTGETFAYQSIGWRSTSGSAAERASTILDRIELVGGTEAPPSTLFEGPGDWQFVFTWGEAGGEKKESAPSPISDPVALSGTAADLDLSGTFPGMDAGLANAPPSGADIAHIYGFKPEFGIDARFGFGQFFRMTPAGGYSVAALMTDFSSIVTPGGGNTGNGTLGDVQVFGALSSQTITVTFTSATEFTVSGSVDGDFAAGAALGQYASANDVLRFVVTAGGTAFESGDSFTIALTAEPRTDGKLIARLADPVALARITEQPLAPWMNRHLEAFSHAVTDGKVIVLGGQPSYSVGEWSFTSLSHVVTPVAGAGAADTPVVGLWMEGRTIRRVDSRKKYRIVKALDQDADGALDALWIAETFDPKDQAFEGAYGETTAEARAVIEGDSRMIAWTNNTAERGQDIEHASPLSRLSIFPPGDAFVTAFKVGEFLYVLGKFNMFLLRQDPAALADLPQEGFAYADPQHIPDIGAMGRRAVAALPQGGQAFLTSKGELYLATPSGSLQKHPASERIAALLSGWGFLTDTRSAEHAILDFTSNGREQLLYIGLAGGGQDESVVAPGVRAQATDVWRDRQPGEITEMAVSEALAIWPEEGLVPSLEEPPALVPLAIQNNRIMNIDLFDVPDPNSESVSYSLASADPIAAETIGSETFGDGAQYARWVVPVAAFDGAEAMIGIGSGLFGEAGQTISPLNEHFFAWMYLEGDVGDELPAGSFALRVDTVIDIDGDGADLAEIDAPNLDPLPAGAWTPIRFANPVAAGSELNPLGLYISCVSWSLILTGEWAGAPTGSGGDVAIRMSNQRQTTVTAIEETILDEPAEPLSFEEGYCPEPATSIETSAPDTDFALGLWVDLKTARVYAKSECRFTCAGIRPSSDCTPLVQASGPGFMGSRDGFANLMFDDKTLTWGYPGGRFVFAADSAAPGTSATFKIERDYLGAADALSLALDEDGDGILAGLVCAKVPASPRAAIEWRRVASNTIDTVTIDGTWAALPAATDTLVIGPLALLVHFAETRRRTPFVPRTLDLEVDHGLIATAGGNAGRFAPRLRFEQFAAAGRAVRVTDLAAEVDVWFSADNLEIGQGRVRLAGRAAKAMSYRLTALQGDDAPVLIRNLAVEERG
jgi:hypothetical protein